MEYSIDRWARKAGKNITRVKKATIELLQSYAWPGNIRELQNVIERFVILCEADVFSIDESWRSQLDPINEPEHQLGLPRRLMTQEREIIEAALRERCGLVFGPTGAAATLGDSTLHVGIGDSFAKNRQESLQEPPNGGLLIFRCDSGIKSSRTRRLSTISHPTSTDRRTKLQ